MRSIAAAVLLFAAACQSTPSPTAANCTLVFLKTGPRTGLSQEESQKIFGGHFANMGRLANEKKLLVAGPFGKDKTDPALRGLFVLDTADRASATQWASSDPGVESGVFVLEYHALRTTAPLRECLDAELEAQAAAAREGRKLEPGANCRNYVLVTADDRERARAALQSHPAVLLFADLDETQAFALIDANDVPAAREKLANVSSQIGEHRFDAWFATTRLAQLCGRAR
jgi:uncharacterized protein YciI